MVRVTADPHDPVVMAAPVQWAISQLTAALERRGERDVTVTVKSTPGQAAESFSVRSRQVSGGRTVEVSGTDVRGLVYGLLEAAQAPERSYSQKPFNRVRSIQRLFTSDVEDKGWFHDREMWPAYLSNLVSDRFNRFNLSFGIGYDFLREVTDAYFLFLYPFLLDVPGYKVRAVGLPDAERASNLETLRYITEQTVLRGLEFQIGIWMHGYQWANSPKANYTIEGLTAENHAAYCRDALMMLLKECPAIGGVTFRIHGESGVAEGSYDFWKTVFDGVKNCGRKVEIDMHSKGIDQNMIDVGLATGMPVRVSPKFWAEHMGMPYHQADIRDQEIPKHAATGLMALSTGSRSFTRYGYADLLREDRKYSVIHRIWPGTQRLLLWADPVTAAQYSRVFQFCGSDGVEIMEPLSFKGRRGSGVAGGRCAYADESLKPRWDWEKYRKTYRVWGTALYNPEESALGTLPSERALASASRILAIVTTTHLPSAANNTYWPEIYTNQPMVDPRRKNPYSDTPSPKTFQNASPLDPQLFSRMSDFAGELLKGERSGKYSPVEVATWLEDLAEESAKSLIEATGRESNVDFRRLAIDTDLQIGLGRFYAAKFRAGVLYSIFEQTNDKGALEEALKSYRAARGTWVQIVDRSKGVYVPDIAVGELAWLRGNWSDRLPAIDDDIAQMEQKVESAKVVDDPKIRAAVKAALSRDKRQIPACRHQPAATFRPGAELAIGIAPPKGMQARLYYRHVNQAERFQSAEMTPNGGELRAAIPAAYTETVFPLQYYFELRNGADKAWLYPGFAAGQPYFVVRRG